MDCKDEVQQLCKASNRAEDDCKLLYCGNAPCTSPAFASWCSSGGHNHG